MGLWCRVKRKQGGRKVGGGSEPTRGVSTSLSTHDAGVGARKDDEKEGESHGGNGWKEDELGANEQEGVSIPGVR